MASIEAKLDDMNVQYAVAAEGGKVWVIKSRRDPNYAGRWVIDRFTFAEWSKLYMNEWVEESATGRLRTSHCLAGGYTTGKGGNTQWHHPRPDRHARRLLQPMARVRLKPIPGSWYKLKNHVREIICAGNEILFEYLMNWIARLFQQPS